MKNTHKITILSMLIVSAIPFVAFARSELAFDGVPGSFSEWTSWKHSNGRMTNVSTSMKSLCIPLVVDTSGTYNVKVNAYGAAKENTVGCISMSTYVTGEVYNSSAKKYLSSFTSSQDIALTGVYVPSGGSLMVCCEVNPSGRVNSVNW